MAHAKPTWKIWAVIGMVAGLATLGACNTVRGAGEDIQSVGKATERTAEKTGAESDHDGDRQ